MGWVTLFCCCHIQHHYWIWIISGSNTYAASASELASIIERREYDVASKSVADSFKAPLRRPRAGPVRFAWIRKARRTGRCGDRANRETKARALNQQDPEMGNSE
jgi:hypothetical protein